MTNRAAIEYVMNNCELPVEVLEKLEKIHASLVKKSGNNGNRKPSFKQEVNNSYKEMILSFMTTEPNRLFTATELQLVDGLPEGISNQRVSALMRQLVEVDKVQRIKEKGRTYFKAVITEDIEK